jgi:uncharacterized protein involved in exopolysaccharide biosynthesis
MKNNDLSEIKIDAFDEEDFDIFALFVNLWRDKILIAGVTTVFSLFSVLYALALTDIYRSDVLLVPAAQSQQSNNSLFSQLGATAGLVGLNIRENGDNQVAMTLATLQSREFIKNFIQEHNLLVPLMAGYWDREKGETVPDSNLYNQANSSWVEDKPSDLEAYNKFRSALSVSQDLNSSLVTVAMELEDPKLAQLWAGWLVDDINLLIKNQDLEEATNAVSYLQEQLQITQLVELKQAFYQLIESQMRIIMLADVREDYVFRVVDPAHLPEEKIRPRRSLICIAGTVFGGIFGVLLAVLRSAIRVRKSRA